MKRLKKYAFYVPFIVVGGLLPFVHVPHYFLTVGGGVALFGAAAYIVLTELTRE